MSLCILLIVMPLCIVARGEYSPWWTTAQTDIGTKQSHITTRRQCGVAFRHYQTTLQQCLLEMLRNVSHCRPSCRIVMHRFVLS